MLERVHVFVKRGDEYEFPDLTLTLQYQFVHVLYQNALYASLQPTRRAALSGASPGALVASWRGHAGDALRGWRCCSNAARDFAASARPLLRGRPARGRAVRVPRGAVARRARPQTLRGTARRPERKQQELGLQMIRGLALRMMKGWAAAGDRAGVRAGPRAVS